MKYFTVRTNLKEVSAPLEVWFTALLNIMPPEERGRLLEMVHQMQGDSYTLLNPNGTTTTVLRADPGKLNLMGSDVGE